MSAPKTPKNDKLLLAGASIPVVEGLAAIMHGGPVGAILALGVSGLVYVVADELQAQGREVSLPRPARKERRPGERGTLYKMFNGKSVRVGEGDGRVRDEDGDEGLGMDEDGSDFDNAVFSAKGFTLSQLLATGWRPSREQIFIARLEDGTDIFCSVDQLVHIALAGATRQGKTSIMRQLMAQLAYVGATCILLDPHFTPYDIETDEDWTPFLPYLSLDPLEYKSYNRIAQTLRHTATTVLDKRKALREQMKPVGKHIFLFIDELPAVIAEIPEVQKYIAKLLREGAKYKIHLCTAAQDYQVKTVSPQAGGALRDSYKTCYYVGGDATTAKVLLDTEVPRATEPILGKGSVYLKCETHKQASLAWTPWTDNDSLYLMLGPSTYDPDPDEDGDEDEDGIDVDNLDDDDALEPQTETLRDGQGAGKVAIAPVIKEKGPKAADIDINILCAVWNGGANSVSKLEAIFKMSHGEAYKAYQRIMEQKKQPVQEQAEEQE